MKKQILIASYPLEVGGTTSSLISLLQNIDYEQYDVDLILLRQKGEFIKYLPDGVRLLPPALEETTGFADKLAKFFIYTVKGIFLKKLIYVHIHKNPYPLGIFQLMSGFGWASVSRRPSKSYDTAIGFMEGWPNIFVMNNVRAKRKIGWIHPDYTSSGLDPKLDAGVFSRFDNIVLVSESCKKSFDQVFPLLSSKSLVIENIVSEDYVKKMAEEPISDFSPDPQFLNIITAARLRFSDKGLDRAVSALQRLKSEGFAVRWYVLGEGEDRPALEELIRRYGLEKDFVLMGQRINPYPYMKKADVYALTSRYEGKPVSVTEAKILGVPVVTTEYAAARDQVHDGLDGIVAANNDTAIYGALKQILENKDLLTQFAAHLKTSKAVQPNEINKLYNAMKN